jgi:hypothetical protein
MIVEMFHWSLNDIDATEIESLIQFVTYYPQWKQGAKKSATTRTVFADQVNWL